MSNPTEPADNMPAAEPSPPAGQPSPVPPAEEPAAAFSADDAPAGDPSAPQAPPAYPSYGAEQPAAAFPAYGTPQRMAPYPPAQPTAAYPASGPEQPTTAYPPAQPPAGAYPPPGAYGTPPAPPAPDSRPKGLGVTSLILAVLGLLLAGAAFLPIPGVSLALALIAGLLLLVAFVLGIVVIANKRQGGKGLGIAAIVVAVFGGIAAIIALALSLVWIGLAASDGAESPFTPPPSSQMAPGDADDDADEAVDDGPSEVTEGVYDEAAYLAAVRPEVNAILADALPEVPAEVLSMTYSDEVLLTLGKPFASLSDAQVAENRDAFAGAMAGSSDGVFTEEHATRLYDAIVDAARKFLRE